ncbi:MAG: RNA-binding protein [Candidatus Diapherotrites archaeon]|uniref:RNA-binding protein n=1 Tax=Candidatus Iainarchaeum sp. TaxID=3101447 RepID=A0A8T3YRA1_9ARCH|nr:RNA-binding protein [Candidatus Diapherotrites archaeon]
MSKRLVIPGELVTEERKKLGSHVFVREGRIYSDSMGLVNDEADFASVVPLEGKYMPQLNDVVIGVITSERFAGYGVDIGSFYPSFVSKKELREVLKPGSIISAKILKVNEMNEVDLGSIRLFFGGEIIHVTPVKVPRVIGKEGSMLNAMRDGTGSNIIVGRNGRIWAKGGNIDLLRKALQKIDREAHMDNLTNRIMEFLRENGGAVRQQAQPQGPQGNGNMMIGEGDR